MTCVLDLTIKEKVPKETCIFQVEDGEYEWFEM